MSKLQEKPSALKRGHPALQKMKFFNFISIFVGHFCLTWIWIQTRIVNQDPDKDPGTPMNPYPIQIRILLLCPTSAVAPQHLGIPGTEPEEDPV
jgi:hypothetical protein